ncbi:LOW QUALITY PROTEIN: hypothetical protein QC761_302830 [Podospora bellae-mahoneyi]|uniref:DUF8021 domain-containing protein n=1 Tax=Podospora bellae-mahoneyi TaxID=2093777 RepID=A0ABR0FJR7_9PEZI|nr:LOW QUALITY PROTEIN: hypothetical protein QC761_302830 [Podospora bellae-mahoneyi]
MTIGNRSVSTRCDTAGYDGRARASCPRSLLKALTAAYVEAQTVGNHSFISTLGRSAPNFLYIENNAVLGDLSHSSLAAPINPDFHRSIHDVEQCASVTEIIAATQEHPYVLHTRIIWQATPDNLAVTGISLIESVVTDEGDWLFNATGTLDLNKGEKWDVIPLAARESREQIQKLGDWYFDRFGDVGRGDVPWHAEPCYRLEGGLPARGTKKGEDCIHVMPGGIKVPYRRYVVDEEMGAVDVFMGFPGLDRTQGQAPMPDSHLFRVEGGKVRYCHTVSACVEKGCGIGEIEWPERR